MSTLGSKVKFADAPVQIIDGDRGKNYPKQNEFSDQGHCLFLNASNVTQSGFQFSSCQFITMEKDEVLRKGKLNREDIVMTTRGTLGNVAYYKPQVKYDHMRINSGMVIFRPNPEAILPAFLYHCLRSTFFRGQVKSLQSGVAQPQLPIRDIKRIEIPLPSFSVQNKIASILSAYDDLIETNNRRIALFEESARLLYREWFVRLRFPGHENTRITDGVPEGWEGVRIGDVITLHYGKSLKQSIRIPGSYPVYGSSGIVGTHSKPLTKGPGIIVGRKGNIGSVFWSKDDFFPIDTVYFVDAETSSYYLYHNLKCQNFISSDVAVPGLNRNLAYSLPILIPATKIANTFEQFVKSNFDQIETLNTMNQKLKTARDLLLPKLMNGEIPV